jgi:hypothetical protein
MEGGPVFVTILQAPVPLTEAQVHAVSRRLQAYLDKMPATLNKAAEKK